jgi:GNAT superfamily N-acetyltransferase
LKGRREMEIRKAKEQDSSQLIKLLGGIGWFTGYFTNKKELLKDKFIEHIKLCSADNSHSIYVAEEDNVILGYSSVHWLPYLFLSGPEGFISELFIDEEKRGKGIGKSLIEAIKKEAFERGCSRLSLLNGRNRESYNRNFYRKCGFTERDQLANFILQL